VGHRCFQRPLSSQGGRVFRQLRRGDAVQTAVVVAEQASAGEVAGILHLPAGGLPLPAAQEMLSPHRSGGGLALWFRRCCHPAGQEIAWLCWVPVRLSKTHSPIPAARLGPYCHTCPAARCLAGEGSFQRGKLRMESEFQSTWICTRFCTVYV